MEIANNSCSHLFDPIIECMPPQYQDSWYLLTTACLVACDRPDRLLEVYRRSVASSSEEDRDRINRRLRDTLQKLWIITGIGPVLAGFEALADGEKELGHENEGGQSEKWSNVQIDQAHLDRGNALLSRLYGRQIHTTFKNRFGSHLQDIRWQQERIVYGIFLSDHTNLTAVETEMVVLTAFMCGRYEIEKRWHLRGFRRLGPTLDESKRMHQAMKIVAGWCGRKVDDWPSPEEVEHGV